MSRLKVLMVTRLFPSREFPTNGTFCAERARVLSRLVDLRVMVPTPSWPVWLPGPTMRKRLNQVERECTTPEGVPVTYPRYLSVPGFATWSQGVAMARAAHREFIRRHAGWVPDVVDGHFAFPDGYAAARLAAAINRPCLVTCHGSDLREYPRRPLVGRMLRWTMRHSARVISVSTVLRDRSIELGCPQERATHLWNGVEPARFAIRDKDSCRRQLGLPLDRPIGVCVGHLIDLKNQIVLLRALRAIQDRGGTMPLLVLVGEGPNRQKLDAEARMLGVAEQVRFAGQRPYNEIPTWMGASDWLLLASTYEGWATVYFEAMACGRPVLTSNVPSARDAVPDSRFGIVVEPNTSDAFAAAMEKAAQTVCDPLLIRRWAEEHSWHSWAEQWLSIAVDVVSR